MKLKSIIGIIYQAKDTLVRKDNFMDIAKRNNISINE